MATTGRGGIRAGDCLCQHCKSSVSEGCGAAAGNCDSQLRRSDAATNLWSISYGEPGSGADWRWTWSWAGHGFAASDSQHCARRHTAFRSKFSTGSTCPGWCARRDHGGRPAIWVRARLVRLAGRSCGVAQGWRTLRNKRGQPQTAPRPDHWRIRIGAVIAGGCWPRHSQFLVPHACRSRSTRRSCIDVHAGSTPRAIQVS